MNTNFVLRENEKGFRMRCNRVKGVQKCGGCGLVRRMSVLMVMVVMVCVLSLPMTGVYAIDDTLARTPQMGWNSWNKFSCSISSDLFKQMADAIVSSGLQLVGYNYVVVDDCWQAGRDADGKIIADAEKFPEGIKALADYVHSSGLRFGLYSSALPLTCQKRPGSLGRELLDAITYANWGVDYLKYDMCSVPNQPAVQRYSAMGKALQFTGRPILFSLCEQGLYRPWEWAYNVGHSWRIFSDIKADWNQIMSILDAQIPISGFGKPGGWNDMDMLEVGNGVLSPDEEVSHFSLWCALKSPLILGNDLRNLTSDTLSIITAAEVISVNQDSLGMPAILVKQVPGQYDIWTGPLSNGRVVVVILNRSPTPLDVPFSFADLNVTYSYVVIRDVWQRQDLLTVSPSQVSSLLVQGIRSHGSRMLVIRPAPNITINTVSTLATDVRPLNVSNSVALNNFIGSSKFTPLLLVTSLNGKPYLCTAISLQNPSNGAAILAQECLSSPSDVYPGSPNQRFLFVPFADPSASPASNTNPPTIFTLQDWSSKCLEVSASNTLAGAPLWHWDCDYNPSQLFYVNVTKSESNSVFQVNIINKRTGLCLDISTVNGSVTNTSFAYPSGSNIVQNTCNGALTQVFFVVTPATAQISISRSSEDSLRTVSFQTLLVLKSSDINIVARNIVITAICALVVLAVIFCVIIYRRHYGSKTTRLLPIVACEASRSSASPSAPQPRHASSPPPLIPHEPTRAGM